MQIDGAGEDQTDGLADRVNPLAKSVEYERDYGPWLIPRNRSSRSCGRGHGGAHPGDRVGIHHGDPKPS